MFFARIIKGAKLILMNEEKSYITSYCPKRDVCRALEAEHLLFKAAEKEKNPDQVETTKRL